MENTNYLKPNAGSVLSHSWEIMWNKFITLFLIVLIIFLVQIPLSVHQNYNDENFMTSILGTFVLLYLLFIVSPFKMSADLLYLKAIRKVEFEVKEIFDVFNIYLNVVLASLLSIAIIGIGIAFFLIPGIVFACRLAFVPFLVMDKKLDAVKAVEESWRLTKGFGWRIFWLYVVSFALIIAGAMVIGFGAIIAYIWICLAMAAFYQAVLEERGELTEPVEEVITETIETSETPDVIE